MVVRWLVTSGGHCGGNACGRRWLFWELEVMWPERSPPAGGGSEGLIVLSWGSFPYSILLCLGHRECPPPPFACPGLQPFPHTMPGVPLLRWWQQWGQLGVLSEPPLTWVPASSTAPCAWQQLQGVMDPDIPPVGKGGAASQHEVSLHSIKELLIARYHVGPSSSSSSPAPGVGRGAISSAQSPEGEGRVPCPLGCYASMTWGVCLWAIKVPRWWGFFSVWGSLLLCFLVLRINLLIICVFLFCFLI